MHYFFRNYRINAKIHNFSIRLHVLGWTTQVQLPSFTFMALNSLNSGRLCNKAFKLAVCLHLFLILHIVILLEHLETSYAIYSLHVNYCHKLYGPRSTFTFSLNDTEITDYIKHRTNKSCWELNFIQKSQWAHISISLMSGARGLQKLICFK